MANRNFKNFSRGTAADKVLHLIKHLIMLKIINMIDVNAGIYHRFINFFDKEFSGSSAKSETMPNQGLAEEWHKPVITKFEKQKVYSSFKDNIWGANLVEIQLISKNKKGFCLSIYVIDIYGKYSWFVPFKDTSYCNC